MHLASKHHRQAYIGFRHPLLTRLGGYQVAAILLCCTLSTQACSADLMEVYWQAVNSDPTFSASQLALKIAHEKSNQAFASNLPTITLNGSDNFTNATSSINRQIPGSRGIYAWSWNLQLTQPIMRPQSQLAYSESEQMEEAARHDLNNAEQTLLLRVAQAYFDVLVAQENVTAAEAQFEAMQEQEKVARRGYELGARSIVDSTDARSKAEQARAQLFISRNDLDNKRSELERLTGKQFDGYSALNSSVELPHPIPENVKAWVEQAKENSPEVLSQAALLRAAEYRVSKARSENIWTADLVASYGTNYASGNAVMPPPYETRSNSSMVGLQINVPIYSGGLNSSHIREAIANQYKQASLLEETRRKAGAQAKQAFSGVITGLAQIEALQASVSASENSVKGNLAGYKVGLRINSDVLNAQQQLFAARHDLIKARYDTLLQGLKLKAAAGILSIHDLEALNELLEH